MPSLLFVTIEILILAAVVGGKIANNIFEPAQSNCDRTFQFSFVFYFSQHCSLIEFWVSIHLLRIKVDVNL